MWETLKSIAFVITTVMIALILQARASNDESMDTAHFEQAEEMRMLDFNSTLPTDNQ